MTAKPACKGIGVEKCIFVVGYLFILAQSLILWIYFDDFGALSLSYMNIPGVSGHAYSFAQLIEAVKVYYLTIGGRISTCFLELALGMLGFRAMTICQSFVIIFLLLTIYKLILSATGKRQSTFVALLVFVQYGLLSIEVNRHGLYWIGASMLYVWNLLSYFVLMLVLITRCSRKNLAATKQNKQLLIAVAALSLLSGMAHELIGAGAICSIVTFLWIEHGKEIRKYLTVALTALLPAIVGYLILVLAPGNFARIATVEEFYQMSLLEKIEFNVPRIVGVLIQPYQSPYLILWSLLLIYVIVVLIRRHGLNIYLGSLGIAASAGVAANYSGLVRFNGAIHLPYMIGFFAVYCALVSYYLSRTNRAVFISILVFGAVAEAVLVMSYTVIERTTYPLIFSMFVISGIVAADCFYEEGKRLSGMRTVATILLLVFGALSFNNATRIFSGYLDNYYINKLNDSTLTELSLRMKRGEVFNEIVLFKLPDPLYASLMPYVSNTGTEVWMKKYYDIPNYVEFRWLGLKDIDNTMLRELRIMSVYPASIDLTKSAKEGIGIGVVPNVDISSNSLVILIDGKESQTFYGKEFISAALPVEALNQESIEIVVKNNSNGELSDPFVLPIVR